MNKNIILCVSSVVAGFAFAATSRHAFISSACTNVNALLEVSGSNMHLLDQEKAAIRPVLAHSLGHQLKVGAFAGDWVEPAETVPNASTSSIEEAEKKLMMIEPNLNVKGSPVANVVLNASRDLAKNGGGFLLVGTDAIDDGKQRPLLELPAVPNADKVTVILVGASVPNSQTAKLLDVHHFKHVDALKGQNLTDIVAQQMRPRTSPMVVVWGALAGLFLAVGTWFGVRLVIEMTRAAKAKAEGKLHELAVQNAEEKKRREEEQARLKTMRHEELSQVAAASKAVVQLVSDDAVCTDEIQLNRGQAVAFASNKTGGNFGCQTVDTSFLGEPFRVMFSVDNGKVMLKSRMEGLVLTTTHTTRLLAANEEVTVHSGDRLITPENNFLTIQLGSEFQPISTTKTGGLF